ncbi:hypothetical protein AWB76_02458 [Caballeronia temeraria]|uniref:Secreted protein n=2 Tax=Caballeronia TaxID=1827195 RepID=A0A158D6P0_9BURK|nr:hypothetical protein AWB76_02458 [Caballeronia temeraria]SAK90259.1 hypothetical protein AWB75_06292 [Caballeronia catudaia]
MKIRAALSLTMLATLGAVLTVPTRSNAEWVQNPIGVPRAPSCDPGYSWQKLGVRYQCATPQPTCAYGFASGPAWSGATWIYSCNAPPPPPPQNDPPVNPADQAKANCAARALQDGITIGPQTRQYHLKSNGVWYWSTYYDHSPGPAYDLSSGYTSNLWTVACATMDDGSWANVNQAYFKSGEYGDCGGTACGGGT